MRNRPCLALVLVSAFGAPWLLDISQAQACSGSTAGNVESRLVIPADAATSVPTNAKIVVTYVSLADSHPVADHLALRTTAGATVPVTISQPFSDPSTYLIQTVYVLQPTTPLQPNTKYLVFSDIPVLPCDQNAYWINSSPHPPCMPAPDAGVVADGGVVASANAISSFTTGSGLDNTPPALSGQIDYSADRQSCGDSACCGPFDGYSVGMSWTAATDGGGPVFYELSVEGMVLRYPIQDGQLQVAGSAVRGAILCSGEKWISTFGTFGFEDFQSKQGNYQIVAVDLAGNRSSPLSVNVTVDCSVVDGGAEPVDVAVDTLPPPADASELKGDGRLLDGARDGLLTIADVSPGSVDLYSTPDLSIMGDAIPGRGDSAGPPPDFGALNPDGSARPDVVAAAGDINTAPPDTRPQKQDAAAPSPDAASPSPDAAPVVASKHDGGCSCRVAGRSDGSAGFALVALGLVLAIRRRFRRG